MKRSALFMAVGGVGIATALAPSACSSTGDGSHFLDDGGSADDGASPDGGFTDGANGSDVNFGTDTPACTKVHCSSDLHAVMCDNTVLKTCPLDQGCAAGACVPACEAAKVNKTTIGCDYFTIAPDTGSQYGWQGSCFAAFVANTWGSPVTLGLERDGQTLNVAQSTRIPSGSGQSLTYAPLTNGQLLPGQVAIVFLSGEPTAALSPCPAGITPAVVTDPAQHGTGIGKAFHLTASAPVVSYDIYPYGGGNSAITSATLLLPTTAWDTNYIAVDAYKTVPSTWSLPWIAVVAAEDQTQVTISPTAAIVGGGGLASTGQGVPATYTINRGQFIQFVQDAELVGSPVQTNKPVAFFGGNTCMDVPTSIQACDGAHQQIPPVKALGSEYVGVRHRNRYPGPDETPPWRLVGAVNGTQLTYEPSVPAGAPTTLAVGQMAEFDASGPFIVKSQDDKHPFYFAQYMTGCTAYWGASAGDCRGDPEFVNVVAALQYLDRYTFFTDPTYSETHLVVVRSKVNGAFKDVSLDCATGPLTGWKPVGTSGRYETTGVDLVTGDFKKVAGCDNGRHEMKSDAPFGVTVWGWGSAATTGFKTSAVSYGYPAGMSVQPINTVVVPPTPR